MNSWTVTARHGATRKEDKNEKHIGRLFRKNPKVKKKNFFKKKTLWPLFIMDGAQLPQGYSHFEEAVYFLPLKAVY